ncbi:MAG: Ig-like domain-containing protein, partial [Deltaproteobacteria bacterium]|nr:Ig-like domain-containing protein [Deltaproteobacteria bacterium]
MITSFSPDGVTEDAEEPIRIQFDQPMVGEDQIGASLEQPPVKLEPTAEIAALWEDRQTLVVRPVDELTPSTLYEVRFIGELEGRVLEGDYSFVYRPIHVVTNFGLDLRQAPIEPRIGLRFNQPVKAEDVERGCHIEDQDSGRLIDVNTPDADLVGEEMVFVPAEKLEQGHDYLVRCESLAGAGGHVEMEEPYEVELRTFPEFQILSFQPEGDDVWSDEVDIELSFSNPVDEEKLRDAIAIHPKAAGFDRGTLDSYGSVYTVKVDLKSSTDYTVRLSGKLNDIFGQPIEGDTRFSFTTGKARPRLVMETGIFAVESAKDSGYPIWTRNLSRFDVDCARVPEKKVVSLLTGSLNYDPWYDAGQDNVEWKKYGLKRKHKRIRVKDAKDKWQLSDMQLGKLCGGKGKKGLFLAEMKSDQVEPDPDYYWRYRPQQRVLANVTDLGLLLKAGSASGILWVTNLSTGKTVKGAAVTVYTPRGRKAWSGTTDKDGIVRLPGADRLLRQPGSGDKDEYEEEAWEEYDMWRSKRLIVVVKKGDDMAVVDGNWANGIQIWNFGVPVDYKGGATRHRGFILSDRGIYRPGEKVHFKGLMRRVAMGKTPEVPAGARVSITVENPRGSIIYDKRHRLTEFGGFDFDLKLEPEAYLGDYYVTARIKDQAFRETFLVEEFRKVSYELDLDAGKRHTRLGKRLKLELGANYLFGAPVKDADVTWSVMRRPHSVHFPKLREYTFNDDASEGRYYFWWDRDDYHYLEFVSDGDGVTDGKGNFRFAVKDQASDLKSPQDYIVQVTVNDQAGDSVSKRKVVTAHKADIYVGLHSQEWVQAVGMPFSVNTVAVTPDGKRIAAKATLSYVRQRQECKYSGGYRDYPTCQAVHDKIWSRRIDIPATGNGTERIMPKEPGEYVIRIEGEDERGNKVAASSFVWVLGKGEAFWSGDESARMTLMTSKNEYKPGETAKL